MAWPPAGMGSNSGAMPLPINWSANGGNLADPGILASFQGAGVGNPAFGAPAPGPSFQEALAAQMGQSSPTAAAAAAGGEAGGLGGLGGLAGAAEGAGGAGGVLGALRSVVTPGSLLGLGEGAGLKTILAGLGKASPYAFAGLAADSLAKKLGLPNAVAEGLAGAGIGATIGSAVPVLGTGVGALAGGAIGALDDLTGLHAFGGGGSDKPSAPAFNETHVNTTIRKLAAQLAPADLKAVNASMTAFKSLPTAQRQQAKSALLQGLPGLIQQRAASQAQLQNALGVQMQMAQAMQSLGGQSASLGDALSQSTNAASQNMPPSVQPLMQWEAAQQAAYGRQVQNAFTGASLAQPLLDAYQQQVQQGQQLANTQYRTATAAGSGSGSQSLASLLPH